MNNNVNTNKDINTNNTNKDINNNNNISVNKRDIKKLHNSDIKDIECSPYGIFTSSRDCTIKLHTYELETYMEYTCDNSYINSILYYNNSRRDSNGSNNNGSDMRDNGRGINDGNGDINDNTRDLRDNNITHTNPNKNNTTTDNNNITYTNPTNNNNKDNKNIKEFLLAGTQKGNIYIFNDIFDVNNKIIIPAHSDNICSLDYYNNYILSSSWDKTVILFNKETNEVERRIEHPAPVWKAYFIRDNHHKYKDNKCNNNKCCDNNHTTNTNNITNSITTNNTTTNHSTNKNKIITCTTDGVIRIIEYNKYYQYNISNNCIRTFVYKNNILYIGCNDGKLLKLKCNINDNLNDIKDKDVNNDNDLTYTNPNINIKLTDIKKYDNFNIEYEIIKNNDIKDYIYSLQYHNYYNNNECDNDNGNNTITTTTNNTITTIDYDYMLVTMDNRIFILDSNINIIKDIFIDNTTIWKSMVYKNILYLCSSNGNLYTYDINNNNNGINGSNEDRSINGSNNDINEDKGINGSNEDINGSKDNNNDINEDINNNDIESNDINLTHTNPNNNSIDNKYKNKFKVENGKVYEYKDGNWVLFGYTANNDNNNNNNNDTTNSLTNNTTTNNNDSITDTIDIELGHNTYELSFNRNNDYSIVARDFLLKNNLSLNYRNEIISFLNNNFNKEEYKIYKNININKIKEIIKDKIIIRILEYICDDNRCIDDIWDDMSNDNGICDIKSIISDNTTNDTTITTIDNNKYKIISLLNNRLRILYENTIPSERYPIIDIVRYLCTKIEEIDITYIISKRSLDSILSYKYNNNTTSPNPNNNINITNPNTNTTNPNLTNTTNPTKNININKIFKKECEVFVRMVTNLYKYNPIDLEQLRYKVLEIKDRNIILQSTIDNYEYNRKLYFIKNKL